MKTLPTLALLCLLTAVPALAVDSAFAGGRPTSPGNSESGSQADEHANIASLAGPANAAHASDQGLAHASDNSMVGKVRTYAALEQTLNSGELQTALETAQAAFDAAYPDFATLTPEEQEAALASPEGLALQAAQQALDEAVANRDEALAALGDNATDPEVKAYIDQLLAN
jgi:hypothetical protein